ncbi:MAG TPA: LuxR C-terminal-related transcriptional regulator [Amycolatopsis sp.]|uniref:LuxR C-terminal-related transcriptional regulator n=1 Tax=Amycolatopsis sp. TaxID=37632 RepID=UPI002B46C196|nr:LuxR C-terminal-related transcriptional regulator [Amycolatopsis sp.]HKS43885.1 LuxR C-terminal-related transcriptional regulator [Amycolatopsis sp.]
MLTASRLVTLAGPGGVGKTRLSLHVTKSLRRAFPDGIHFVDLAVVADPNLVPAAVAAALGLPDTSGQDVMDVLEAALDGTRPLIVLDNCEHVVTAVVALVERLLTRAAGLRFLITSREPLGVLGEHVLPVPPLSTPDPGAPLTEQALDADAVALFAERASSVAPEFRLGHGNVEAVVRLCRRLDGLPLAIELAAAWLRAFSVEEILARLDAPFLLQSAGEKTAPARHRTLEAAVGWSFDLCPGPERALWARLSAFSGSFDLRAAESVGEGPEIAGPDITEGVAGLVEKSVLVREAAGAQSRYRMLETIRAFGRQRLAVMGEQESVRIRHRDHYLGLAENAEADWFGARQAEWLGRCQLDQPDLWAALGFSLDDPDQIDSGGDLAYALWWFWINRGVRDGRRWLDRAVAARPHGKPRLRWITGWLAIAHGDVPGAVRLLDGPPDGVPVLDQAVADYQATGMFDTASGLAWCNLPTVAALLGDEDHALALCEDWSRICVSADEQWTRSWVLWVRAVARWRRGETTEAQDDAMESLRLKRRVGDQLGTPAAVALLARFATARGDAKRAAYLFGTGESLWEPMGRPVFGWGTFRDWAEQWGARAREMLGERAFDSAYASGREADTEAAVALALGEEAEREAEPAPAPAGGPQLTRRELQVANLIADGQSNKEIAATLVISQRTAETHVENILSKLGLNSRTQIAAWISRR